MSKISHPLNMQGKVVQGTQSVVRALGLLRMMAGAHASGLSLPELVAATGLERATVYRLASSLVQTGFAERDAGKRYRLGIESMQLGLAAMTRAPLLEACRALMQAIARRTEDTVYLVVRSGDYGHCLHREEGAFPIKTFTVIVGSMMPLGLGTAGQALLATIPREEVDVLYERHRDEYEAKGFSNGRLRELVQRIRQVGYSETENILTPGVAAVGRAFSVKSGALAAVSVGAIRDRMEPTRREWIANVVAEEVRRAGFAPVTQRRKRPGALPAQGTDGRSP